MYEFICGKTRQTLFINSAAVEQRHWRVDVGKGNFAQHQKLWLIWFHINGYAKIIFREIKHFLS